MTYQDLLEKLHELTPDQLACDVTVELDLSDEFIPVNELRFAGAENDVLDTNHPILYVKDF